MNYLHHPYSGTPIIQGPPPYHHIIPYQGANIIDIHTPTPAVTNEIGHGKYHEMGGHHLPHTHAHIVHPHAYPRNLKVHQINTRGRGFPHTHAHVVIPRFHQNI